MLNLEQSLAANTSLLDPAYAQFRDQTRFWIQRVAVPLLMVIGLFGNLITMIIMTRRGMRSTTNMYLAALAFVDMLYLVLTFLLGLSHYPNMAGHQFYIYWQLKPFLIMLTDACSNTSVWLTVTFTIERYIAVKYPMKGKVWCTEKRAKMLIMSVFMFGTLFASPVPFEWKVIEKRKPADLNQWQSVTTINGLPTPFTSSNAETSYRDTLSRSEQQAILNASTISLKQVPQAPGSSSNTNDLQAEKKPFAKIEDTSAMNNSYILTFDLAQSEFGRNETYKTFYYWSIAVIFYFVPLFSLMLFNGFLIKSVHQSKRERTKMTRRVVGSMQTQRIAQYHPDRPSKADINMLKSNCNNDSSNQLMESELPEESCETSGVTEVCTSGSVRKYSLNRLNKFRAFLYPSKHKKKRSSSSQDCSTIQSTSLKYPFMTQQHISNQRKPTLDGQIQQNINQTQPLLKKKAASTATISETTAPMKPTVNSRIPTTNLTIESSEASVQSSSCDSGSAAKKAKGMKAFMKTNKSKNNSNENSIQRNHEVERAGKGSTATIRTLEDLPARQGRSPSQSKRSLTTNAACSSSQQTIVPASTQERRITIMLIAVVILFLFCQIPSAAMLLYTSVREMEPNTNEHALVLAFGNIFNFLVAVNAAGNFILYSFLSKKYRRTFVILFCGCLGSKQRQYQASRMLSVRFEASRMSQRNSSIYQNSSRVNDKIRKDTLV